MALYNDASARLQYLEDKVQELETSRFRQLWTHICHLTRTQLNLVKQILRTDATMGARLLLKRNDISARYVGQALMVTPCQPVQIDYIFWNYKVGQHCYALLPVMHNDTLYFVLHGSTDLVSQAPRIDCSLVVQGVYKDARGI